MLSYHFPLLSNLALGGFLAALMVALTLLGRRVGIRHLAGRNEDPPGLSQIEGAVFALLGLLIALTFYGAVDRFQDRKFLVLREAQSVGTAYARLDLLSDGPRRELQGLFRGYVGHRLDAYAGMSDPDAFERSSTRAQADAERIWTIAVQACRPPDVAVHAVIILPALNEMFDIELARRAALRTHPPRAIYYFLFALALASAYLSGFGMARAPQISWGHVVGYALIASLTICVTLDIEHPRFGMIRVDASDALLRGVLQSMR